MSLTTDIKGVGPSMAAALSDLGIKSAEDLARCESDDLVAIPGIGTQRAHNLIKAAKAFIAPEILQDNNKRKGTTFSTDAPKVKKPQKEKKKSPAKASRSKLQNDRAGPTKKNATKLKSKKESDRKAAKKKAKAKLIKKLKKVAKSIKKAKAKAKAKEKAKSAGKKKKK